MPFPAMQALFDPFFAKGLHHTRCHPRGGAFTLPQAEVPSVILPQAVAEHRAAAPETIRVVAAALPAGDHTIEVQAVGSSTRSHTITVAIPLASATDTVTILSAMYMKGTLRLTVKATSSAQPNAVLTVLGYGTVTYNAKKKEETFQGTVDSAPATVTVQSSKGGIATMAVR